MLRGLELPGLMMIVMAAMVYVSFAATLGLWFSCRYASTLRATLFSVLVLLVGLIGPSLIGTVVGGAQYSANAPPVFPGEWWQSFLENGPSPHAAMQSFCYLSEDLRSAGNAELGVHRILMGLAGVQVYLLGTLLLWLALLARFRRVFAN